MDHAINQLGQLPVSSLELLRKRRSAKWRMNEADVLPVSIAEMDFDLAEPIATALHAAIDRGDLGYADGFDDLADAYCGFAEATWGWRPDSRGIVPVTDVGVGVVEILRGLGARRVILSSPVYPPFQDWVSENRADLVDVPLRDGRLDLDQLDHEFHGGGVYLLCNPQNPTGTVHTRAELEQLVSTAGRYGVSIISDEIHAPVTLSGAHMVPILTVHGADETAVALTSASKAWNLAGLKCALAITSGSRARSLLATLPPDTRWRVGSLGVVAATVAFRFGDPWRQDLLHTLADRHHYFQQLVADQLPELSLHPAEATYLAWLDCANVGSGTDLADAILRHGRVAVEPGERFGIGGAHHIRVNLATSRELLERAVLGIRIGINHLAD